MTDEEKRQAERYPLRAPAMVECSPAPADANCLLLMTRNLSGGGAYFSARTPVTVDTDVKVGIFLEVSKLREIPVNGHVYVQASGTVLRSDATGMAVRFLDKCQVIPICDDENPELE